MQLIYSLVQVQIPPAYTADYLMSSCAHLFPGCILGPRKEMAELCKEGIGQDKLFGEDVALKFYDYSEVKIDYGSTSTVDQKYSARKR